METIKKQTINISENINRYFKTKNGVIAGPFIETENRKYWDVNNEILYFNNGRKYMEHESDEDLIELDETYRMPLVGLTEKSRYVNRKLEFTGKLKRHENNDKIFIDVKNNKEYHNIGWFKNDNKKSVEDLIVEVDNDVLKMIRFINQMEEQFDGLYEVIPEDQLCQCNGCIEMRETYVPGKYDVENYVQKIRKECLKYVVELPELPSFFNLTVIIQHDVLRFYCDFVTLFDIDFVENLLKEVDGTLNKILDVDDIDKKISEEKFKIFPDENEKEDQTDSVVDKRYINEKYAEYLKIKERFFIEKNLVIEYSFKKFSKLSEPEANGILDGLQYLFMSSPASEKIRLIKFRPLMKGLDFDTVMKYGFFASDIKEDGITLLNPQFVYSVKVLNGKVDSILPISRKSK